MDHTDNAMNIAVALAHQPLCDLVAATLDERGLDSSKIVELRGTAPHGTLNITGALCGTLSLAIVDRKYKLDMGDHIHAKPVTQAMATLRLCAERLYASMCRFLTETIVTTGAKWQCQLLYSSASHTLYFNPSHKKRIGIVFTPRPA